MITRLCDVEHYLARLPRTHMTYEHGLKTVKMALDCLGKPQNKIPAIHIAGTSGKGSTAYYAAALLRESGHSVGLAVSPHVNSVAERSQIDGKPLPEAEYCRYFHRFIGIVNSHGWVLSYIEFITTFTYWLFAERELDYMVIEVGLGGRLDPTNVINRENTVRVITDIGLDHTTILGNTLTQITKEKAGIIHSHDTVVIHPQASEVMKVVESECYQQRATLAVEENTGVSDVLLPAFQQRNWTLAYRAATERLLLDNRLTPLRKTIAKSLSITIPGRFERFVKDDVSIILDAAHNPQKLTAFITSVVVLYPNKNIIAVVAFGTNKRIHLKKISRSFMEVYRSLLPHHLCRQWRIHNYIYRRMMS